VRLVCNCSWFHDGAPAGTYGCGAEFGLEVKDSSLTPVSLTPRYREADLWAEQVIRDRLPRIRELAEKWSGTVSALTGLLSIAALVGSEDQIRKLQVCAKYGYGVVAIAALLCAGAAILNAARAAQAQEVNVPVDVTKRFELREGLIAQAQRWLGRSRVFAFLALALVAFLALIRWYGPVTTP
jgi:hypothetical protein